MNAQNCKYDFDEKDPMTNERVRRNTYKLKSYLKISLYRRGNEYRVEANFRYGGEQNYVIKQGEEILIKLADDSLLKLPANESADPVSNVIGNYIITDYAISYNISEKEMNQISNNGIAVTRLTVGGQEVTVESSKREVKITAEGASCILKN